MKVLLKKIVSIRSTMFVKTELEKSVSHFKTAELNEVKIKEGILPEQCDALNAFYKKSGVELIDEKKSILIETIKNIIVELVHYSEDPSGINFSAYLCKRLNYDYKYLANLFLETQGFTIEHFRLLQKIERVKELLIYNELNITEIAWNMHYRSVSHLSGQFKKITGLTCSLFKEIKLKKRAYQKIFE